MVPLSPLNRPALSSDSSWLFIRAGFLSVFTRLSLARSATVFKILNMSCFKNTLFTSLAHSAAQLGVNACGCTPCSLRELFPAYGRINESADVRRGWSHHLRGSAEQGWQTFVPSSAPYDNGHQALACWSMRAAGIWVKGWYGQDWAVFWPLSSQRMSLRPNFERKITGLHSHFTLNEPTKLMLLLLFIRSYKWRVMHPPLEMTHGLLKEVSSGDCLVSQRGDCVRVYFIDLINHT